MVPVGSVHFFRLSASSGSFRSPSKMMMEPSSLRVDLAPGDPHLPPVCETHVDLLDFFT